MMFGFLRIPPAFRLVSDQFSEVLLSLHGDIDQIAYELRSLISKLRSGSLDAAQAAQKINSIVQDLEYVASKVKRLEENQG